MIHTSDEVGVLVARRQSYLFDHQPASGAYPGTSKFHVDAIEAAIEVAPPPPEVDPEAACYDPLDPNSWVRDPADWPEETDRPHYVDDWTLHDGYWVRAEPGPDPVRPDWRARGVRTAAELSDECERGGAA